MKLSTLAAVAMIYASQSLAFWNSHKVKLSCEQLALSAQCIIENLVEKEVQCEIQLRVTTVLGHKLVKKKTMQLESLGSQSISILSDHADPILTIRTKVNCQ
ncbi:hypothetical protein M899_0371 [Bacteriovorax sp. BSW11_IV]|uniref:hypothetical protein n=1 Tax=Bacteriovorax sp. BSW11_IV TaxID=1353529 RepID=UPI00038A3B74|nr:hypothetical protein [Bacteriovorax sp. BSW11_IV]EQC43064.1 hypothetical protein M899_0371 [Bacteriovorax sp. BSW11_IV]